MIFILADDLGYKELGCYGQTKIRTPPDKLAEEGMRFTRNYSGNAVCAPSRCVNDRKAPGECIHPQQWGTQTRGAAPHSSGRSYLGGSFQKGKDMLQESSAVGLGGGHRGDR